jgi:hypothetical protein
VHADEQGPYILHSEVEKAIKVTRDKKAVRDDNIYGDVLRILGEDGLRMTQLINNMHETGEWPKDFTEVGAVVLKKKPQAAKCMNHRTFILTEHTVQVVVARILGRRIERKIGN